jgi:hypothetical protein
MSADLPPLYKAPPVQLYSWSGCYFGGQLGQMWARQDWTDRMGPPAFGRSSGNLDATGFVGGVQGGCNYQTGPIVFGVQGDYLWANARGSNDNPVIPALYRSQPRQNLLKDMSNLVRAASIPAQRCRCSTKLM